MTIVVYGTQEEGQQEFCMFLCSMFQNVGAKVSYSKLGTPVRTTGPLPRESFMRPKLAEKISGGTVHISQIQR